MCQRQTRCALRAGLDARGRSAGRSRVQGRIHTIEPAEQHTERCNAEHSRLARLCPFALVSDPSPLETPDGRALSRWGFCMSVVNPTMQKTPLQFRAPDRQRPCPDSMNRPRWTKPSLVLCGSRHHSSNPTSKAHPRSPRAWSNSHGPSLRLTVSGSAGVGLERRVRRDLRIVSIDMDPTAKRQKNQCPV